jgi:hypothetical protein
MNIAQIKTVDDLGNMITEEMVRLQNKSVGVEHARAMAMLASRVVSILRIYLEIYRLNGHELKLESCFLDISKMLNSELKKEPKYKNRLEPKVRKNNGKAVHHN